MVLFDDVKSCLIDFTEADNRRQLLLEALMMLGARLPDETTTVSYLIFVNTSWKQLLRIHSLKNIIFQADVASICGDFDKLPKLENRQIGIESFVKRLFEVAALLYPSESDATYFACAQLAYAADTLTATTDIRPKDRSKQFKKIAKELMEKRPRDCWPLYATYAEQLARLGDQVTWCSLLREFTICSATIQLQ